jgi:hypothetical protein
MAGAEGAGAARKVPVNGLAASSRRVPWRSWTMRVPLPLIGPEMVMLVPLGAARRVSVDPDDAAGEGDPAGAAIALDDGIAVTSTGPVQVMLRLLPAADAQAGAVQGQRVGEGETAGGGVDASGVQHDRAAAEGGVVLRNDIAGAVVGEAAAEGVGLRAG